MLLVQDIHHNLVERRCDPAHRLAARLCAGWLDRELAEGTPPEASALLATRAQQLVASRHRGELAGAWEQVVDRAGRVSGGLGAAVPLQRARVLAARRQIGVLARQLRGRRPVDARGVALAAVLLTDGAGPLYDPVSRVDLRLALDSAVRHLGSGLGELSAAS